MIPISIDNHIFGLGVNFKPHFLQTIIQNVPIVQHSCSVISSFQVSESIGDGDPIPLTHLLNDECHLETVLKLVCEFLSDFIRVVGQLFHVRLVFIAQNPYRSQPSIRQILYFERHLSFLSLIIRLGI